jgi:hypothetical protein
MKTNNNDDVILLIKKLDKNKNIYKRRNINKSFLNYYKKIYDEIKSVNSPKLIIYKSIEIHLNHPKIKEIIIDNENDWKFLFNYNIIQECINKKNNKIIINFELKNLNESLDIKKNNFEKLFSYILKNIPQSFDFDKFFKKNYNFDFVDFFNLYVKDELIKTDLKSIAEKNKNYNDIKKLINNFKIQTEFQSNEFSKNTENFYNICEKNEKFKNLNPTNYNSFEGNYENTNKGGIETNDIHFTQFKPDFDEKKIIDENKLFRKLNKEEYYAGIEEFKKYLNKEIFG